jgi:hypothetical protein
MYLPPLQNNYLLLLKVLFHVYHLSNRENLFTQLYFLIHATTSGLPADSQITGHALSEKVTHSQDSKQQHQIKRAITHRKKQVIATFFLPMANSYWNFTLYSFFFLINMIRR